MSRFRLAKVRHAEEIAAAATLFREYADWLGIDLSFQGFEAELASLPGKYAPPMGELMLACSLDGGALGCVAVRPLEGATVCEMKRLYVRPAARGLGIGRTLVAAIIKSAESSAAQMKLDTLPACRRPSRFTNASDGHTGHYHSPCRDGTPEQRYRSTPVESHSARRRAL